MKWFPLVILKVFFTIITSNDAVDPCKYPVMPLKSAAVYVKFSAQCIAPLGMENEAIKDEDITASSSFDSGNVGPQHGR